MNNYSRGSSAATNTSNSGYDPASNYSGPGAFAQPGALQQPQQQADDAEEQVTQLTLAGLTVLMVRKKDQVIYKLPDNMSVDSLSSDQRKLLMDQITTLHAATLSAATTTNASHVPSAPTPIAPRNAHAMAVTSPYTPQQNGAQLQQMIEAQQLKMKQMEEEARRRQEQLQQLTPLARRQQQQQQQQQQGTAGAGAGLTILPTPGTLLLPSTTTASQAGPQTPEPTASTIGGEVKTTRKYIKTGKYSKKRIYAQQGQQNPEQYGGMVSSLGGSAVMAAMVAAQQHQQNQQNQQAVGAGLGMPGSSAMNPLVASSGLMSGIGSVAVSGYQQPGVASAARKTAENEVNANGQKRLPEEVAHHQEVKRRFTEALATDQRATLQPNLTTPFESLEDAIGRLLPYHIYQIPEEDMKLNERSDATESTADTTVIQLHTKRKKVFEKYYNIIKKEAKNPAPSFLGVLAERLLVDDEKHASSLVQEEYHRALNAKNELARREKEATMASLQVQIQIQAANQHQANTNANVASTISMIGGYQNTGGGGGGGQLSPTNNVYSQLSPQFQMQLLQQQKQQQRVGYGSESQQ